MVEDIQNKQMLIAIEHIERLLCSPTIPPLPQELADNEQLGELHAKILTLREHMTMVFKGDLSQDISLRGYIPGLLKGHLANLRHLTWQVAQVAKGDFTQRVDFMGEFSEAFNDMVQQLDTNVRNLKATEEALKRLTKSLQQEVELRTTAVYALKQSEARFKYLANHDALTGALNRRSFFALAEAGFKTATNNNTSCCIALLDIDFFKKINDTYGHQDGDLALKHVVAVGNANLRQSDSLGRYGGEEFIFFFADANIEQGKRAAERIRSALEQSPVPRRAGPIPFTVSLGVAEVLPEWHKTQGNTLLEKIIALADAALYKAKRTGRNQTCTAPVSHPEHPEALAFIEKSLAK